MDNTPLLVNAVTAAKLLGISRTLFYEIAANGQLGVMPVRFNSKKLWSTEELRAWVRAGCKNRDVWLKIREGEK